MTTGQTLPAAGGWPVATIPTPPTPNHPGGQQLPLRWPHHGDLRILVDVDTLEVFIAAVDLIALAELDDLDPADLHPTIRPHVTWSRTGGGEGLLEHYTLADVQQAAMILDRDPAVAIGRTRLFEHLERIGWTRRGIAQHWEPTSLARRHHWLTIRTVSIRPGTKAATPYPQLYVTPTGLDELRRTLLALHPDAPATLPEPHTLPI